MISRAMLERMPKGGVVVNTVPTIETPSDEALAVGAELVVHAYPDGRAPGRDRLAALGLPAAALVTHEHADHVRVLPDLARNVITPLAGEIDRAGQALEMRWLAGDRLFTVLQDAAPQRGDLPEFRRLHQDIAARCERVLLTVAGLPLALKGDLP